MLRHKTRVIESIEQMSENRIDKLQIARRELDFAILTQCRREESLAVHLLAFSACTRSGREALMARADELHVEPGPRTYAEMDRITALRST